MIKFIISGTFWYRYSFLISSHLPLKYLKLSIIQLEPFLKIYLPHIIVKIFAQNLKLLFQVCVQFIMVRIICSYGSVIWNMIAGYIKVSETLEIFKGKIWKWKVINCPCCLGKKKYIYIYIYIYTESRLHQSPQVTFLIACPNLKSQYQKLFLPLNTNSTHAHTPLLSARGRS